VHEQEGDRTHNLAPLVHEVDVERTEAGNGDGGRELLHRRVDRCLMRAPVVPVTPVLCEPPDIREGRAVLPRSVVKLVREAGERKTLLQVIELPVRHVDRERLCCSHRVRQGNDGW
jgi:hypothetical protein